MKTIEHNDDNLDNNDVIHMVIYYGTFRRWRDLGNTEFVGAAAGWPRRHLAPTVMEGAYANTSVNGTKQYILN